MSQEREAQGDAVAGGLTTFLAGIGLGALLGAGLALLLAPQSGVETREDVRDALSRLQHRTDEVLKELRARVGAALHAGREAAAEKRQELHEAEDGG